VFLRCAILPDREAERDGTWLLVEEDAAEERPEPEDEAVSNIVEIIRKFESDMYEEEGKGCGLFLMTT
jgi:hypothetical protein